ncbi:MAG: LamG-like jellyroll fold domain-containing protein, partial [Bacteroidia bacterium]
AGTWDGAVSRIYVNGVLSGTASVTYPAFNNTTNQVWIGGENAGSGEYFKGSIDEMRIWNRTLCAGELLNNKNGEIPTNATGLLANYHFNQGLASETNTAVTTLTDASSSIFTGTLTNFALTTGSTSNWILPGGVVPGNTVTPYVTPTISVNSGGMCSGTSFTINPSGASTYTLQGGSSVVSPTATTSYSVIGTTSLGCLTSTVFSTVTVNATPTISVNSGSVCAGSAFTITPSGASTYTIQGGSAVVSPTTATSYTVAGTSTAGCVSAATATSSVTVGSVPTVSASTSSSIICSMPVQQTATLTATGAATYSWSSAASGSATAVSPSVTTTYTVTGTAANGCMNTAMITQSVSTCTGVEAVGQAVSAVMVYPNPNNGVFTLSLPGVTPNTTAVVKNVLGQVILSEPVSQEKTVIDAASLKNGIYFVEVYMENTKQTIKFIKE